ncbi:hypothetical protein [Nonomuraea sp. NPDC049309]|uniref:hypothetical protein n=1 Tax=Nonomuraea sp. NPDC049309 TaxID=3364350 RepID=UPI003717807D
MKRRGRTTPDFFVQGCAAPLTVIVATWEMRLVMEVKERAISMVLFPGRPR